MTDIDGNSSPAWNRIKESSNNRKEDNGAFSMATRSLFWRAFCPYVEKELKSLYYFDLTVSSNYLQEHT